MDRANEILKQYRLNQELYVKLSHDLNDILSSIIASCDVKISDLAIRIKSEESLMKKVNYRNSFKHINDVHDVVACRIITLFEEDIDVLAKALEENFEVVLVSDRMKKHNQYREEFGYNSLHYTVKFSKERCKLVEYKKYDGILIEIQLRSALQHAWCEIEHGLGYKSQYEVPAYIRRRLNRLSATLELLDEEFVSISKEIDEYNRGMDKPDKVLKTDINNISLAHYATQHPDLRMIFINQVCDYDESTISQLRIVKRLNLLGFGYIHELDKWVNGNLDKINKVAKVWMEHYPQKVMNYFLVLLWIVMAIGMEDGDNDSIWNEIQQSQF